LREQLEEIQQSESMSSHLTEKKNTEAIAIVAFYPERSVELRVEKLGG
jgi:hypothetical protein